MSGFDLDSAKCLDPDPDSVYLYTKLKFLFTRKKFNLLKRNF
jgi:hypothetical protein